MTHKLLYCFKGLLYYKAGKSPGHHFYINTELQNFNLMPQELLADLMKICISLTIFNSSFLDTTAAIFTAREILDRLEDILSLCFSRVISPSW